MGTEITLSLNAVDIDYGKNRYWTNHHWLFPPGCVTNIDYHYANNVVESKPGFETNLGEANFRLSQLGYSMQETQNKFNAAVKQWNRKADLRISFDDFRSALISIAFEALTSDDLEPYIWDFRGIIRSWLSEWDTDEAALEDFIASLDVAILLRVLGDRAANHQLPLRWHYQDLVESGWATLEDLTDIDFQAYQINHIRLFGRLQDHSGMTTVKDFDAWLVDRGLARDKSYKKLMRDGSIKHETTTLPIAVRNMIHHPENPNNELSSEDLRDGVESLLQVAKKEPGASLW